MSVGFAATLTKMGWVTSGDWPDASEREQIVALITAMLAMVLSWDGYLLAIKDRPHVGIWRFAIDIVIVFTYMLLVIASQHMTIFLIVLTCIFSLYFVWDLLTVCEYPKKYLLRSSNDGRGTFAEIGEVYLGGAIDRDGTKRGPIITLSWALYFLVLTIIAIAYARAHVYATCLFAAAGLILYRLDNNHKQIKTGEIFGFKMIVRGAIISALLVIAGSYYYFWQVQ
jgi:hypothetical protein